MNIIKKIENIINSKNGTEKMRVVAFGSSNTERTLTGLHWFDCFELAIKNRYGSVLQCINSGIGGDTANDLLRRFNSDAGFYKPDVVFITIGGNDANPDKNIDNDEFEARLYELHDKFKKLGTFVIFQTYYSPIKNDLNTAHKEKFFTFMDIIRDVAKKTDSGLIDHLAKWSVIDKKYPEKHLELMRDAFHVTPTGNVVLGLYISHCLNIPLELSDETFYAKPLSYLKLMSND